MRFYHIADKADFKPNPRHEPTLNRTIVETLKPGIFLTEHPTMWAGNYGYRRPYLVEFDVPADVLAQSIKGTNEIYVPAEFYDRLRITKVYTQDGFEREKWLGYGSVESEMGIDHITGQPLVLKGNRMGEPWYEPPAGGWTVPDARTLPADVRKRYEKDFKAWRRKQPKGFMASKQAGATFEGEPFYAPGGMVSYCRECGFRVQKRGTGARWKHMEGQPNGEPWEHTAQPGGPRVSREEAANHWRQQREGALAATTNRRCEVCGGAMPNRTHRQRDSKGRLACDSCKESNMPEWTTTHSSLNVLQQDEMRRREAESLTSILRIARMQREATEIKPGDKVSGHAMGMEFFEGEVKSVEGDTAQVHITWGPATLDRMTVPVKVDSLKRTSMRTVAKRGCEQAGCSNTASWVVNSRTLGDWKRLLCDEHKDTYANVGTEPRRLTARKVAHDSGHEGIIHHCPFCGSGAVTAGSDGSVDCDFCHSVFTVQAQPQHPNMPQTINGQPVTPPGMPGGTETELSAPSDPAVEETEDGVAENPLDGDPAAQEPEGAPEEAAPGQPPSKQPPWLKNKSSRQAVRWDDPSIQHYRDGSPIYVNDVVQAPGMGRCHVVQINPPSMAKGGKTVYVQTEAQWSKNWEEGDPMPTPFRPEDLTPIETVHQHFPHPGPPSLGSLNQASLQVEGRRFFTAGGDVLDGERYLKHLAIEFAEDRESVLAQIREAK